jgi:hypothetical protein
MYGEFDSATTDHVDGFTAAENSNSEDDEILEHQGYDDESDQFDSDPSIADAAVAAAEAEAAADAGAEAEAVAEVEAIEAARQLAWAQWYAWQSHASTHLSALPSDLQSSPPYGAQAHQGAATSNGLPSAMLQATLPSPAPPPMAWPAQAPTQPVTQPQNMPRQFPNSAAGISAPVATAAATRAETAPLQGHPQPAANPNLQPGCGASTHPMGSLSADYETDLSNLMMAWYHTGFFTARFQERHGR